MTVTVGRQCQNKKRTALIGAQALPLECLRIFAYNVAIRIFWWKLEIPPTYAKTRKTEMMLCSKLPFATICNRNAQG